MSLHLNAFACPSPIEERKWGWAGVVARGHVPPSKATLTNTINLYIYIYIYIVCVFNIFHLKCIFSLKKTNCSSNLLRMNAPLNAPEKSNSVGEWRVSPEGGFRRRDTARGHPSNPPSRSSATPKPTLYYLPLIAQGTPFTHPPSRFFQGHSVGHSFTKDNNWNCYLFF